MLLVAMALLNVELNYQNQGGKDYDEIKKLVIENETPTEQDTSGEEQVEEAASHNRALP